MFRKLVKITAANVGRFAVQPPRQEHRYIMDTRFSITGPLFVYTGRRQKGIIIIYIRLPPPENFSYGRHKTFTSIIVFQTGIDYLYFLCVPKLGCGGEDGRQKYESGERSKSICNITDNNGN